MNIEIVDDERDRKNSLLYVDKDFYKKIYKPFYKKKFQQIRACCNQEELLQLIKKNETYWCRSIITQRLAAKRYFSFELKKKLGRYQLLPQVIDMEIERCQKMGYIDDQDCLHSEVQSYLRKGKGPLYIASKLQLRSSFRKEVILELATHSYQDQHTAIKEVLDKRFKPEELKDYKIRKKAFQFLVRRGFQIEAIMQILAVI